VKLKKALKNERKKYKDLAASILAEGRDAEGGGGRGEGPAYLAAQGFQEEEEVKLFRISENSIFLELGFHRFQSNRAIGCRRCIGCLKLQVSFRRKATDYGAVLQKVAFQNEAL